MRREMIITVIVLMFFNNYLTAEVLSIAAVSPLDPKFDIYLPLNKEKNNYLLKNKNNYLIYTKYGSISAEYGYDLTFRASSI